MDDAIAELDNMDSLVSSYKIHLNVSIQLATSPKERLTASYRQSVMTFHTSNLRTEASKSKPKISEHF